MTTKAGGEKATVISLWYINPSVLMESLSHMLADKPNIVEAMSSKQHEALSW
jgi:hypothetical protein